MTYFKIIIDGDLNGHHIENEHVQHMIRYLEQLGCIVSEAGVQTSGIVKMPE